MRNAAPLHLLLSSSLSLSLSLSRAVFSNSVASPNSKATEANSCRLRPSPSPISAHQRRSYSGELQLRPRREPRLVAIGELLTDSSLSSSEKKEKSNSSKRKLKKRLSFHAKVKDAVATSLGAKKAINKKKRSRSRQNKLKAYDLSALSEFLQDLDVPQQRDDATNVKLNCKSRQKLVLRESAQLRAVLNNPAFQMDPISAIHYHLESTQPAPPPPPVPAKKEGKRNRPGSVKRKNRAKKKGANGSSAVSQSSMDM